MNLSQLADIVIPISDQLPTITITHVVAFWTWFWLMVLCICAAGESVASTERYRDRQGQFAPMPEAEPAEWKPA